MIKKSLKGPSKASIGYTTTLLAEHRGLKNPREQMVDYHSPVRRKTAEKRQSAKRGSAGSYRRKGRDITAGKGTYRRRMT